MLVHRSIEKDVFEPLVMRISEIAQHYFGTVGSSETGEKGPTVPEFPEKIKWEVQHLEELFEGIKEDKEEVYEGFKSVSLAISEWQRRLAIAYQNAARDPRPFEGMKWAMEYHEMWVEDNNIIGAGDEILDFDEHELFESLRYVKTAQGGSEAHLLESIKSGMQCIKNVLATIRSRKEADNRSWCIVEQVFSPLLKLLKTINHLVSEAAARNNKSENYKILIKIDAEVNCLQDALDLIDRNKNEVYENFRLIEDLILPLLTFLKATYNDQSESLSFLDAVKHGVNYLEGVLDKIEQKQRDGNDNFHIVKAAFSPLLTCMYTFRRISLETLAHEDKSDAFILLDRIRDDLSQLKDVLQMVQEKENGIYSNFDAIEEHIDEIYDGHMNVEGSLKLNQMGGLRDKLQLIHEEITNIRGKVDDSFKVQEVSCHVMRMAAAHEASSSHQLSASNTFCITMESAQMWQLKVIIDELETRLRHCLLCLAVFPVDAIIKKRLLIHWWIGECFVTSVSEGKSFFNKLLLSNGFITPVKKYHCDKVHSCKVQPWIRGLLIEAAKSKAFVELSSDGSSRNDFTRTRRACLHAGKILTNFHPDVLTIYNIKQQYVELNKTWFSEKNRLTTLQLGQWHDASYDPRAHHVEINNAKFLKQVKSCKQLKYLSLRGISRIEALPNSIGKLSRLVILDLKACHNLEDLPKEIVKLVKLEYLDVSDCYLLSGMPKGLGKLFQLEVLKGFVLSNAKSKDLCHLNELVMLKKLRKLSIRIGYSIDSGQFANFGELCALRSLTLIWGAHPISTHGSSPSHAAPHAMPCVLPLGLEKLELRCFPLVELPHWVSPEKLRKLKKLYISGGNISDLGDLKSWEVTVLRLRFLKHMNYSWTALHDSFRKLDVLEAHECENLQPWPSCGKGLWRKEPNGTIAPVLT